MKLFATYTLIILFSLTIVFHILVLVSVIPNDIVWGSRLSNPKEIALFETISIALNTLFLLVILISAGILKVKISSKIIKGFIWGMMVFFLLNTIGNLASESTLEKIVFTPLTLFLSISLLFLVLPDKKKQRQNILNM